MEGETIGHVLEGSSVFESYVRPAIGIEYSAPFSNTIAEFGYINVLTSLTNVMLDFQTSGSRLLIVTDAGTFGFGDNPYFLKR